MGKTGKWLKHFLTGKKDKDRKDTGNQNASNGNEISPANPFPSTPKEKRRWSFRRSSATAPKELSSAEPSVTSKMDIQAAESEDEQKKHARAVAAATAAAADAAVAAAQAAAVVIRLTAGRSNAVEETAATKIQSVYRGYLARKALCALKGLVKLQALVRGHLVRKQATATLRCMQALVTVQARARAQRLRLNDEFNPSEHRQSTHRKSTQENRFRHPYHENDRGMEENIKIVEMDHGESKGSYKSRISYSNQSQSGERADHKFPTYYPSNRGIPKQDDYQFSPVPSALTDMSPRGYSNHFEDYSFGTAQSSPQYFSAASKPDPSRVPFAIRPDYAESMSYDHPLYPNYMANTESSRAKVRSQSAPKSRPPDTYERQPSRRRASIEGRNIPRAMRMQRSSSHVGTTAQNYQYPWSIKLDRSTVSLIESECGSTSTVLTNNYCRSLVSYDPQGNRY